MNILRKRAVSKSKGSVLIEFALIFPILTALIFGMIEVSGALFVQYALMDASMVAARVLSETIVPANTTASAYAKQIVVNQLTLQRIKNTTLTVTAIPDPVGGVASQIQVNVTLRASENSLLGVNKSLYMGNITLQASSFMRKEF